MMYMHMVSKLTLLVWRAQRFMLILELFSVPSHIYYFQNYSGIISTPLLVSDTYIMVSPHLYPWPITFSYELPTWWENGFLEHSLSPQENHTPQARLRFKGCTWKQSDQTLYILAGQPEPSSLKWHWPTTLSQWWDHTPIQIHNMIHVTYMVPIGHRECSAVSIGPLKACHMNKSVHRPRWSRPSQYIHGKGDHIDAMASENKARSNVLGLALPSDICGCILCEN